MSACVRPLLAIDNVTVAYSGDGTQLALNNLVLNLDASAAVGLLGASGSGKTTLALSLLRLLPQTARTSGSIEFAGHDLLRNDAAVMRRIRGRELALVDSHSSSRSRSWRCIQCAAPVT
jgi:ABC-type glutathione transport system ATPase component